MYVRTRFRLAFCALPAILSGCNTIYVGNVPFKAVEVCTEELASRLHPHSGCLPPTRAANAQRLYLARFRLEVSPGEAKKVIDSAAALESPDEQPPQPESAPKPANQNSASAGATKPQNKSKNLLPSWIGRVFRVEKDEMKDGEMLWTPPKNNDMEFFAIGKFDDPPESGIETETLVSTDLSGVVEKKLKAGAALNPADVVDRAFGIAGIAKSSELRDALVGKVVQLGYERNGFDHGKGRYYYVSMKPRELDSLTSALTICGWDIRQEPVRSKHEPDCAGSLKDDTSITEGVKNLIGAIQTSQHKYQLKTVGIVIGVALLHTERGMSELCTKRDISLLKGGDSEKEPTKACGALKALISGDDKDKAAGTTPKTNTSDSGQAATQDNAAGTTPKTNTSDSGQAATQDNAAGTAAETNPNDSKQATTLSAAKRTSLLVALSAEYSRAAYKSLTLHRHTSVLAIHWIPVRVPPSKKK